MYVKRDSVLLKTLASFAHITNAEDLIPRENAAIPINDAIVERTPSTARITRSNSSYTRLSDATKHTNTKSRRSKRIQNKERAKRAKLNVDGPLGYFDALPPEVAEQVFLKMDLISLSRLALTSKTMMQRLIHFSICRPTLKRTIAYKSISLNPFPGDKKLCNQKLFYSLGLLMKRASCLWTTSRRLSLMVTLVKEIDILIDHSNCASINCREVGMLCYYGTLLQTFIAGWDSAECTKVLMVIDNQAEIKKKLTELLRVGYRGHFRRVGDAVLDDQQLNEIKIRYHYLKLFVEAASTPSERWLWLLRILAQYNREERAILLLMMFLPLDNEGKITWDSLLMEDNPESLIAITCVANVVSNSYRFSGRCKDIAITEDDIIGVCIKMMEFPGRWSHAKMANFAVFLPIDIRSKFLAELWTSDNLEATNVIIELAQFQFFRAVDKKEFINTLILAGNHLREPYFPNAVFQFMFMEISRKIRRNMSPAWMNDLNVSEVNRAIYLFNQMGTSLTQVLFQQ
ncbi:uncharacterized protein LOC136024752 isoform X1 [Artemia franciscana]|uniref:uncharacterized protein LOC136024752 isoform X1 n=1 Tax=Artemia franciscana TaxID=6661 RepID=UPI0032DA6C24